MSHGFCVGLEPGLKSVLSATLTPASSKRRAGANPPSPRKNVAPGSMTATGARDEPWALTVPVPVAPAQALASAAIPSSLTRSR